MTVRIEFSCDARSCKEYRTLLVDDAVVGETRAAMLALQQLGWTLVRSTKGKTSRGTNLKVRCPTHKGSSR